MNNLKIVYNDRGIYIGDIEDRRACGATTIFYPDKDSEAILHIAENKKEYWVSFNDSNHMFINIHFYIDKNCKVGKQIQAFKSLKEAEDLIPILYEFIYEAVPCKKLTDMIVQYGIDQYELGRESKLKELHAVLEIDRY